MIKVEYHRDTNTTKVFTEQLDGIVSDCQIVVKFKNIITDEIHYEAFLGNNSWCTWCGAELITDVEFYNTKDHYLMSHKWDIIRDGDKIEKALWIYLNQRKLEGKKSNGLVIGTHDGRNGHWVYSIKNKMSRATLIDGSEKQFANLVENYKSNKELNFINSIVTVEGGDVTWYQGGEGYTDTVKKEIIKDWLSDDEITKTTLPSISFKKLIMENEFDWLHLDVEGIDGDLIMSLPKLPNIIIYESINLPKETQNNLQLFFEKNSYIVSEHNGNTLASKK